jgi:hypothetical protein
MKAKPTACYFILQGNSGSSAFDFSATDAAMFFAGLIHSCVVHQQNSNKQD